MGWVDSLLHCKFVSNQFDAFQGFAFLYFGLPILSGFSFHLKLFKQLVEKHPYFTPVIIF